MKRLLASLLTLCMLLSMIPIIPEVAAVAANDGYTFVYDFNLDWAAGEYINTKTTYQDTNGTWQWAGESADMRVVTHKWGLESLPAKANRTSDHWFAFKVKTPIPGTYTAVLTHGQRKAANAADSKSTGDVYFIPADGSVTIEDGIKNSNYQIGDEVAYYNASKNVSAAKTTISNAVVAEGVTEYYLVFVTSADTAEGDGKQMYYQYPHILTLSSGSGAVLNSLSATIDKTELDTVENKTAQLSFFGVGSDLNDKYVNISDYTDVTFKTEPEGVVTVSQNGVVTAVGAGTVAITTSLKNEAGDVLTASPVTITVIEGEVVNPEDIPLSEYKFVYDFNIDTSVGNALANYSYDNTYGLWEFGGSDVKSVNTHKYGVEIAASKKDTWTAFKVYLPVAGRYGATLDHGQSNSSGGYGNVYVLPVDGTKDLASEYKSGTKIGENVCYYRFEGSRNTSTELDWVIVPEGEEGEYYIVFESAQKGGGKTGDGSDGGFRMYPHTLTLNGGDKKILTGISATVEREKLDTQVMNKTLMTVVAHGSDMTTLNSADYDITFKSSDTRKATVSETGEIKAIKDGKVTITASAVNEFGRTVSASNDVIVGEEGIKIIYSIGSDSYALKGADAEPPTLLTGLTYDYTNGFYRFIDSNLATPEEMAGMKYKDDVRSYFRSRTNNIQVSKRSALAFEVYVPENGEYEMHIYNGISEANGGTVDVYMCKSDEFEGVYKSMKSADAEAVKESMGTYLGTYDCYGKGAGVFNMITPTPNIIEGINLEKGKYVFSFLAGEATAESGVTSAYGSVGDFVLTTGGDIPVVMSARISGVQEGVAEAKIVTSDKSEVDANNSYISYHSSNPEVAFVNSKTGHIKKLSNGTATIYATVASDEFTGTLSDEITVTDAENALSPAGVVCEYDFTVLKSGWTPFSNLAALKQNVVPKGVEPGGVVEYTGATRDTDIRGVTYAYTDGKWQWFGSSFGAADGDAYKFDDRARLNPPKGEWVAFTVNVPAAGRYNASIKKRTHVDSGEIANVYVVPKGTTVSDIEGALNFNTRVGRVAFLDPAQGGWALATEELCIIDFPTSGEYVLVFECYKKVGPQDGMVNLTGIILDGENKLNRVNFSAEKTTLGFEETAETTLTARKLDGTEIPSGELTITYESSDPSIVDVDKNGVITSKGDGHCTISATVFDGKTTIVGTLEIIAVDETPIKEAVLNVDGEIFVRETVSSSLSVIRESGNTIDVPKNNIAYSFSDGTIVSIDEKGKVTGLKVGTVEVTARALYRGEVVEAKATINVTVDSGKSEPTYYTYERREAVLENVSKYTWAKKLQTSAINATAGILENYEVIYNLIPREGIPRSRQIGSPNDPNYKICRYCGENIVGKYGKSGTGGWESNSYVRAWKVQCPDCKRYFPSNDFALLYKRGLDENGIYNRELAKENNAIAVANGEKDALRNELYPELSDTINGGLGLRPGESVETWGVDDGWGYIPKDEKGNPYMCNDEEVERHCYIALYHNYFWTETRTAIDRLRTAYIYTGDIKYGRAGAILLDRIADVYHEFDLLNYNTPNRVWMNSDGGSRFGQIQGKITDNYLAESIALAADAFYPAIGDSQVINFLSGKSAEFGLDNSKSSAERIWDNWDGLLVDVFDAAKAGRIKGNFGMIQATISATAVVLDREPDSAQMLDWLYETEVFNSQTGAYSGANVASQLIDVIDRDGMGNESGPHYNRTQPDGLATMAEYLTFYKGDPKYNPVNNPKFMQMFMAFIPIVSVESQDVNVGDSMSTAGAEFSSDIDIWISAFKHYKDEDMKKRLAQYIYLRNGKTVKNLNYGILETDPERIQDEILAYAEDNPEPISEMMTGYGLSILRDGSNYKSVSESTAKNTLRDFWIYAGTTGVAHAHKDALNLGVEAYGLNLAPDLGYPENTGSDPNRIQWVSATISHNTVSVDNNNQAGFAGTIGRPQHFDDVGFVKLMDVEANDAYTQTENYRRSLVMVKVNDEISYGVDFFRVTGGDKHTYSFHAQSENAVPAEGLEEMTAWEDPSATYASVCSGDNVPYGADPDTPASGSSYTTRYPRGYTWMRKVRQDKTVGDQFAVDFEITDYRKAVKDNKNIHLRMTQINNFNADEVAIVGGMVPVKTANAAMPEMLDYVLVHRNGTNLDSLFTTVYEPYKNERYIESIEPVEVSGEVSSGNMARAVKITHVSGRVDYVVYATDNSVIYTIKDKAENGNDVFKFRGFVGVYSLSGETPIYRYVNDGDIISADGSATGAAERYTGTVKGYQKELDLYNYIDVAIDCDNLSELEGKYIYINNDDVQNGVYHIESATDSAEDLASGCVRLDLGAVSLIRAHKDIYNIEAGYVYNILEGQSFVIPTSFVDAGNPKIAPFNGEISASSGSVVNVTIKATSTVVEDPSIEYLGTTLPRGASLDSETGVLTWKPTSSQIGENHVAVTARDSLGRESTIHFKVTVYGSTSAGTGGGGGGETTTPTIPSDEKENDKEPSTDVGEDIILPPAESDVRFTDLGNHAWAADAINALADEGIIKGTSKTTFSPASKITRADFAILLVRAFGLSSDNEENFADVAASDYFAKELAIARNTGIVGGIGDNKYAPKNFITRQDMMVIVYRALIALGKIEKRNDTQVVPYDDFDLVAEYAKEAVSALVTAGLVNGKNSLIAPLDNTTRAEVAVLIKRILDYVNK